MATIALGESVAPILASKAKSAFLNLALKLGGYLGSTAIGTMAYRKFVSYKRARTMRFRPRTAAYHRRIPWRLMPRQEVHYISTGLGTVVSPIVLNASGSSGGVTCINEVGAGAAYFQRTGRQVKGLYIECDIHVLPPSNAGLTDEVTMALVLDKNQNGTNTGYGTFFNNGENVMGLSMKNIAVAGSRLRVLKMWKCAVAKGPPDQVQRIYFTYKIPPKYALCQFSDDSTTPSIPVTNGINFVTCTLNATAATTTSASVVAAFRYAFYDTA